MERIDEERGPVKAQLFEVDGTKKGRPKKRWKEVLECDMTARGLQRLDAQDRKRWQLGCKYQLPLHAGNLCWAPEIEGSTFLEKNDDDNDLISDMGFDFFPRFDAICRRDFFGKKHFDAIQCNCYP